MLLFTFYSSENIVTVRSNDTVNQKLDDIIAKIIINHPGVRIIEIFYRDENSTEDIATFFDGYIYSSCRQGAQIL